MTAQKQVINFGAGPAALPQEVLEQASAAILDYNHTGLSILGIPHRAKIFDDIIDESKELVLSLAGLSPDDYEVLWLQGGGRLQFAMIPMNFLGPDQTAGYIDSGFWAHDAQEHARLYGNVHTLASSREQHYRSLPQLPQDTPAALSYVHLTTNNTIFGTQLQQTPDIAAPLIADMSSDIFSGQRDYNRYDLFYAVAQKNIGAAGVTLVVLRKKMLDRIVRDLSPALDYRQQVLHRSVLNTPPVFAIYTSLLTLRWTKAQGIAALENTNREKAALLYAEIDRNPLFEGITDIAARSRMNAVFRAVDPDTGSRFLNYCQENGVEGISGHRSVGGFRVSMYNATSVEQVAYLVSLMRTFEQQQ